MIPYDVYVLSFGRARSTVDIFLRQFAESMEESAGDYSVPQYADKPIFIVKTASELIDYLTRQPAEPYNICCAHRQIRPNPHVVFAKTALKFCRAKLCARQVRAGQVYPKKVSPA